MTDSTLDPNTERKCSRYGSLGREDTIKCNPDYRDTRIQTYNNPPSVTAVSTFFCSNHQQWIIDYPVYIVLTFKFKDGSVWECDGKGEMK